MSSKEQEKFNIKDNKDCIKVIELGSKEPTILSETRSLPNKCLKQTDNKSLLNNPFNPLSLIPTPTYSSCNYQQGSYWPRLRGSNNYSDGVSTVSGPLQGNLLYSFDEINLIYSIPVIDKNGILYFNYFNYIASLNYNLTPNWLFSIEKSVYSALNTAIVIGCDGTLYFNAGSIENGDENSTMYALNPNGTVKWSVDIDGSTNYSTPIIINNILYTGTSTGYIYGFNTSNGNIVFTKYIDNVNFNVYMSGDDANNLLIIVSENNNNGYIVPYRINLLTGNFVTTQFFYGSPYSMPAIISNSFFTTYLDLVKWNKFTGEYKAEISLYSNNNYNSPVIKNNNVYIGTESYGFFKFYVQEDSYLELVWQFNPSNSNFNYGSAIIDNNNNIYLMDSGNDILYCISDDDASVIWSTPFNNGPDKSFGTPIIGKNNILYLPTADGMKAYGI